VEVHIHRYDSFSVIYLSPKFKDAPQYGTVLLTFLCK